MNQPIRCEPLPFLKKNGEAAAEAPLCTEADAESTSDFGQLLNAELSEAPKNSNAAPEEQSPREAEALAAYGVAPLLVQMVPQEILISARESQNPTTDSFPRPPGGEEVMAEAHFVTPNPATLEPQPPPAKNIIPRELQLVAEASEQNLPSQPKEASPPPEQISGKQPEPAKKSNGMVTAQRTPMLMTSQQEKSALRQEQPVAVEHFEAPSFEQYVRIEPVAAKPLRSEQTGNFEATAIEADLPQTPRFEVVSGEIELQPARPVEPVTIVEEIRTHIELLKTSTAEKLDVVVRPDAQTELKIQVEKVNGQIHVQVRCDRGDFAALETQWSAIQNSLATQGIRIEPLQQGTGAQLQQQGSHNSHNFSGQHSNQREERPAVFIEQEFTNREGNRLKPTAAPRREVGKAGHKYDHRPHSRNWKQSLHVAELDSADAGAEPRPG